MFCFVSQQLHAKDKEYGVASELLALGVESTDETNATYVKVLFLLSRAMILLVDRKLNEVLSIFPQASNVIENSIQNLHLKEYLKVFYLVLQASIQCLVLLKIYHPIDWKHIKCLILRFRFHRCATIWHSAR